MLAACYIDDICIYITLVPPYGTNVTILQWVAAADVSTDVPADVCVDAAAATTTVTGADVVSTYVIIYYIKSYLWVAAADISMDVPADVCLDAAAATTTNGADVIGTHVIVHVMNLRL